MQSICLFKHVCIYYNNILYLRLSFLVQHNVYIHLSIMKNMYKDNYFLQDMPKIQYFHACTYSNYVRPHPFFFFNLSNSTIIVDSPSIII